MLRMSKLSPRGPQSLVHGPTEQMQIWKLPFLWTPNDFLASSTLCLVKITYPCLKYIYTLSKRPYYAALPCYSSPLTPLLVSTSLITSSAKDYRGHGLGTLSWALHQPFTQIIQLRAFHSLQKRVPRIFYHYIFHFKTLLGLSNLLWIFCQSWAAWSKTEQCFGSWNKCPGQREPSWRRQRDSACSPTEVIFFITSPFRQQEKVTESLTLHFLTLLRCISHSQHPRKLQWNVLLGKRKAKTTNICLPCCLNRNKTAEKQFILQQTYFLVITFCPNCWFV